MHDRPDESSTVLLSDRRSTFFERVVDQWIIVARCFTVLMIAAMIIAYMMHAHRTYHRNPVNETTTSKSVTATRDS